MPEINPNDPRPPYLQIAADIRRTVGTSGRMPGDKLPSNRELANAYGVAPMTVHQAIRELRDAGILVSYQGRGVFVANEADSASSRQDDSVAGQLRQLREDVDAVASRPDVGELRTEIVTLQRHVGRLEAQLIDLYSKTGQPYPHDTATPSKNVSASKERRRASGA